MSNQYLQKSEEVMKQQSDIINRNISRLTPDVIKKIRDNAGLNDLYQSSVFRPAGDIGLLLFKKERKSPSEYTINILTLRPTMNSLNKTALPTEVMDVINNP